MTVDPFKQVLFNDGEEMTFGDQNDGQNFDQAQLTDQILESFIGDFTLTSTDPSFSGKTQADAANHLAYCLHGGSAYLRLGSANNKVQIAPGVLFQKIATKNGNASTLLPYFFDGTSTNEFTIATGNGSNPRVDLLQMSLTMASGGSQLRDFKDAITGAITSQTLNKRRQVNCTLSVKQGTPGASPVVPDPDAGFVAVGTVLVGTSYATTTAISLGIDAVGAVAILHDQRMPMRINSFKMLASEASAITAWTNGFSSVHVDSSAVTNDLQWLCTPGNNSSRLVGMYFLKDVGIWTSPKMVVSDFVAVNNINMNTLPTLSAARLVQVPYYTLDAGHAPAAGPSITPSTTNKIGAPLWSNGTRCAVPHNTTNQLEVILRFQTGLSGSQCWGVTFFWAG